MLKLSDYKKIHFIGICGISMKSLAMLCKNLGKTVTGSDKAYSSAIETLNLGGIYAYKGSDVGIVKNADMVVYTASVPDNDKELRFARENNIVTLERKQFLGLVSELCDKVVAIAGTHGKTTTTAMICEIMKKCDVGFIGHVGGDKANCGISLIDSGREFFVTEACEYKKSLLSLSPDIAVVLNVQFDHPDCYNNLKEIEQVFLQFCDNIKEGGTLIVCENSRHVFSNCSKKVVTYGFGKDNDFVASDIKCDLGRYEYSLIRRGEYVDRIRLNVCGKFNILNSLAGFAVADLAKIDLHYAKQAIENFSGVKRRFELKGQNSAGAMIISDYAHHPDEIKAVIDTAREMTKGKITVLFEPHTYSRTKSMIDEFADSFYWADEVIILPTYASRESVIDGGTAFDLYKKIKEKKRACLYIEDYGKAKKYIDMYCYAPGIVLLLGAGDIEKLAQNLT